VRTDSPRGLQDLLTRLRSIRNVSRTVTTIALDTIKEAGLTSPVDGKALRAGGSTSRRVAAQPAHAADAHR
jgi:hypothetical protein